MRLNFEEGVSPPPDQGASTAWPKGLLLLTVALAVTAPLAMYSGRVPGLGEFDYLIFYRLLFYNDFANSLAMLAALLLALAIPALRNIAGTSAAWIAQRPVKTCIGAFVILATLSRLVYQGFPLAMDEYAPLLQARIFAQGDIAITYPRELLDRMVVPGFQGSFILVNHETGQATSGYWPGLALLMAPLAALGLEWWLNPLFGAAGLWLIGDLARQASGREEARGWAMLAALASPQYTVNAISYYAMSGLLTLNLLFLWLLLRPGWKHAALAGVIGSMALVLHNPAPHTLFAVPCIIWMMMNSNGRKKLLPLAAGYLPIVVLLCLGWPLLTSSMGLRPSEVSGADTEFLASWLDKLQRVFIMPNVEILLVRSYAAWKTMIWAAPGLLLVAVITKPASAIQRLLLATLLVTFAFYLFFPYDQGHGWGYRYLHPAWGLLPVALGVFATSVPTISAHRQFASAALMAGVLATPVFMFTTRGTIAEAISQQPPASEDRRTFVFITPNAPRYTVDLVRNYPKDQGRVIRMWSEGTEADHAFMAKIAPTAVLSFSDPRGSVWQLFLTGDLPTSHPSRQQSPE